MRKSRFTTEQIVGILKEQEAGAMISELCRRQGIVSRCLREPHRGLLTAPRDTPCRWRVGEERQGLVGVTSGDRAMAPP
jgi:hypothetical protein